MRDLEEVRQTDINKGNFDVYVDDVDFPDELYEMLRKNDVCRISDINPETAPDPEVFEILKKETAFYREILAEISNGEGMPLDSSFKSVIEKILEYYHKDNKCLNKVRAYRFVQNPIFVEIINRDIFARYCKVDIAETTEVDEEKLKQAQKIQQEYHETTAIIEGKKAELKNEIKTKKIEEDEE